MNNLKFKGKNVTLVTSDDPWHSNITTTETEHMYNKDDTKEKINKINNNNNKNDRNDKICVYDLFIVFVMCILVMLLFCDKKFNLF